MRPDERAVCQECGAAFEKPAGSGATLCPACRRKRISAGRKLGAQKRQERKAMRERDKAAAAAKNDPAASSRQVKTGNKTEPEGAGDVENGSETDRNAWNKLWDELEEKEKEANKPDREPEPPEPDDWSEDELRGKLAKGLKKDAGDVVLALYECIRDVARTAGMQPRIVLETMYEIDCTLSHVG